MLELLKRRGSGESFDAMGLLQTLCLVKMDTVDGNKPPGAAGKQHQPKCNTADSAGSPNAASKNNSSCSESRGRKDGAAGTEMKGERRKTGCVTD